ncbi:MAG: hypothetical protein LBG60_16290 [Bifidobacteriaceae bacterium]|nr:hypothetical protein [Bifidobacteriaceae bacterium]
MTVFGADLRAQIRTGRKHRIKPDLSSVVVFGGFGGVGFGGGVVARRLGAAS